MAHQRRCGHPPASTHREFALRADGQLAADEGAPGERSLLALGAGLGRARASETDPPSTLTWTSEPLTEALDFVGDVEFVLEARATAIDTAWIVTLQEVAPDDTVTDVTAGWLRASLREVDAERSRPGAPVLPCRRVEAVVPGEVTSYRVPLVPNARRFRRRPSHPRRARQRRPGHRRARDHGVPPRERRHEQPQHGALVVAPRAPGRLNRARPPQHLAWPTHRARAPGTRSAAAG